MSTVRLLLQGKPRRIWSVETTTSVTDAMRLMSEKNVGALPVLADSRLAGIVSERDFVRKLLVENRPLPQIRVDEVMTHQVVTITLDHTVEQCMELMTDKRIRHLPVIEGHDLVGIISIGDCVKAIISSQEFVIGQLNKYISNS